MPKLKEMTSAKWKGLKAEAGIASSSWYQKGHASVGKYIEKANKARETWKASKADEFGPSLHAMKKYASALMDLEKHLKSFLAKKEFNAPEAKSLKTEIQGWLSEITAKLQKFGPVLNKADQAAKDKNNELAQNDAARMMEKLQGALNI